MSVGFVAMPLDAQNLAWAAAEGAAAPAPVRFGRWPTSAELRAVLLSLEDWRTTFRDNTQGGWDAYLDAAEGEVGVIWTKHIDMPNSPAPFTFHRATPRFALRVLERLSYVCGAFLLVSEANATPVLVAPGADVESLRLRLTASA